MNKEDIIAMAREAGFVAYGEDAGEYRIPTPAFHGRLERFAALVAAAEREACAKLCEESVESDWHNQDNIDTAYDCAAAIRERGNT